MKIIDIFDKMIYFQNLVSKVEEGYDKKVESEVIAYMNQNGYDCKRIQ